MKRERTVVRNGVTITTTQYPFPAFLLVLAASCLNGALLTIGLDVGDAVPLLMLRVAAVLAVVVASMVVALEEIA